jgi:DNA modification methylase
LLIHYTDEYDLVVDPMAGGGMTVDVCTAMGRRYAAFDASRALDG